MDHYYKWVLVAGYVLVPSLVLAKGNRFHSWRQTLCRALVAVIVGWLWLAATRVVVTAIDLRLAVSDEEIQAIVDGDGAKNVAVLLFGWVPSLGLVVLSWAVIRLWRALAGSARAERAA